MSQPPNASTVSQFISRKKAIPRGTTDVVMERLFPSKRSEVPVDEERREAVYAILHSAGLFNEEDGDPVDEQDHGSEERVGEGAGSSSRKANEDLAAEQQEDEEHERSEDGVVSEGDAEYLSAYPSAG